MITKPHLKLTYEGAQTILSAAIAKARQMGVPQCVAVVDEGGHLLAFARMDGARTLSVETARRKAATAASTGRPTGAIQAELDVRLALATDGRLTNLKGGLPIVIDDIVVGGIGVGSGTGDQDLEVATAAIAVVVPGRGG
jgi:uncharacterized protein GlcG (DUF336 family)